MILNERDYIGGLKQWAGNHMKAAKDTALAVAGSKSAVGRLNIRATTDELIANWKEFCGQREQAGVKGWDRYDPTMSQIEQFLKTRYKVDLNMSAEPDIADAAEDAGVEEGGDETDHSDDDAENQALAADKQATTPDEVAQLKRMAAGDNVRAANKPGPAKRAPDPTKDKLRADMDAEIENDKKNGVATRESVELNEAGRGDALRRLFGVIAMHMFDKGLVQIRRGPDGKVMVHTRNGANPEGSDMDTDTTGSFPSSTTIETRVDKNGNYLNAQKLRANLRKHDIDGATIERVRNQVKRGSVAQVFRAANGDEKTDMVKIAAATIASIQKSTSKMKAGENITASGNTVNFNTFTKILEKNKVGVNAFNLATKRLNKANADGEIDLADVQNVMSGRDETAIAVLGIMGAMVMAIESVGRPKAPEKQEQPQQAPQQNQQAPQGNEKAAE